MPCEGGGREGRREGEKEKGREGRREGEREKGREGRREGEREGGREQKTNVIRQTCLVSFMSKEIVLLLKLSMCVKRKEEEKKVGEERKGMEREAAPREGDYGEGGCDERGLPQSVHFISCTKCSFACRTVIPLPP